MLVKLFETKVILWKSEMKSFEVGVDDEPHEGNHENDTKSYLRRKACVEINKKIMVGVKDTIQSALKNKMSLDF